MPYENQVCLKLFDNLKVGLLFKYCTSMQMPTKYYQKDIEKHII